MQGLEHLSYKGRLRELGQRSLQEKDRGDVTNVYEYLMGRSRD